MTNKFFICSLLISLCCLNVSAQKVTLDYYFNHEVHTEGTEIKRFHYLWDEKANTGFSIWGQLFKQYGATLDTLGAAPTVQNLKQTAIYIIVDPDSRKESPNPKYIGNKDVEQIANWVRKGGVLVLMANDSANVELPHFNTLAQTLGFHFDNDIQNHVIDDSHFEDGAIVSGSNNVIFKTAQKLFMKDACGISMLSDRIIPVLMAKGGKTIALYTKFGKGTVFAVGDPWLYNEYVNGRLPVGFENDKAAKDLTAWLLKQVSKKRNMIIGNQ